MSVCFCVCVCVCVSSNGYSCACVAGYSGPNCQTNVNECGSNPCQNGASCVDAVNSFTCSCVGGFSGLLCTIPPAGGDSSSTGPSVVAYVSGSFLRHICCFL